MRLARTLPAHGVSARLSPAGLGAVVAVHALALWALLHLKAISLPAPLSVLSVSLLAPPAAVTPEPPAVEPPRPRPVERQPAPAPTPLPTPTPLPQVADTTPAAPRPAAAAIAVAPAPTPARPAPTPPRFDADYLDNPKPPYPSISRRMGEQGRVVLRVQVTASGAAAEVTLHSSSGSERLDAAALDTVRRWQFVPARLGDQPVAAAVLVPISFSLKD